MRSVIIAALTCCLSMGLSLGHPARALIQREDLPWTFHTLHHCMIPMSQPGTSWTSFDWNEDGSHELAVFRDQGHTLQLLSFDEQMWNTRRHINLLGLAARHNWSAVAPCGDLNEDRRMELAITRVEGDSLWIDIHGDGSVRGTTPIVTEDSWSNGWYDARLTPLGMLHDPEDDEALLIALSNVGHDTGPRGVFAYSLETGEEAWRYETGPGPYTNSAQLVDLDGDGRSEVLFTMPASANGRRAGATDDHHAYVMALRGNGELLWLRELGRTFSYPSWCEVLRPASDLAVVITCTDSRYAEHFQREAGDGGNGEEGDGEEGNGEEDDDVYDENEDLLLATQDSIHVWHAATGARIQAIASRESLAGLYKLDDRRIAVGTIAGTLSLYPVARDGRLEAPKVRVHTKPVVSLRDAADLDGDGEPELIGITRDFNMHLSIMSSRFELMADMELPSEIRSFAMAPFPRAGRSSLLLLNLNDHLFTLELLRNAKPGTPAIVADTPSPSATTAGDSAGPGSSGPVSDQPAQVASSPWSYLGPVAAGLVAVVLILAGRARHKTSPTLRHDGSANSPTPPEAHQAVDPSSSDDTAHLVPTGDLRRLRVSLLMATEIGNHGHLSVTRVIRRFVWLLEAVSQQESPAGDSLKRLRETARDFVDITSPQIEQILGLGGGLRIERPIIADVECQRRALEARIGRLESDGWTPGAIQTAVEPAREAADRIEAGLKRIRLRARHTVTQPLMREIDSAVASTIERCGDDAPRISLEFAPPARTCYVRAARGDLAVIMENLLTNAVRALRGQPDPMICVKGWVDERFAIIQVIDNGIGIIPEQHDAIFQAGISSRANGGTGLFASRRLLDDLGGSIRVKSSQAGVGTTMELRLIREDTIADGVGDPAAERVMERV